MSIEAQKRVDPSIMLALGFNSVPANKAKETNDRVSADGDDVWIHEWRTELWTQGLPLGMGLFNMIFNCGKHVGDSQRVAAIRDSLGL